MKEQIQVLPIQNCYIIEYYLHIIDQGLKSIEERFEQLEQYTKYFGFLYYNKN